MDSVSFSLPGEDTILWLPHAYFIRGNTTDFIKSRNVWNNPHVSLRHQVIRSNSRLKAVDKNKYISDRLHARSE